MRSFVLTGCSGVASDKAAPFSDRPGRMLLPHRGRCAGGETALPGQGAARPLRSAEAAPLPGFQGRSPCTRPGFRGCAGLGSAIEVGEEEAHEDSGLRF